MMLYHKLDALQPPFKSNDYVIPFSMEMEMLIFQVARSRQYNKHKGTDLPL